MYKFELEPEIKVKVIKKDIISDKDKNEEDDIND